MTIQTKQVEVFVVGDKEFPTLEQAQEYELKLKRDFDSYEDFEAFVEEELKKQSFAQYAEYGLVDLYNECAIFQDKIYDNQTIQGKKIFDKIEIYAFNKYFITSIRSNYPELAKYSDKVITNLYGKAYSRGHSDGISEVAYELDEIVDILKIVKDEE